MIIAVISVAVDAAAIVMSFFMFNQLSLFAGTRSPAAYCLMMLVYFSLFLKTYSPTDYIARKVHYSANNCQLKNEYYLFNMFNVIRLQI